MSDILFTGEFDLVKSYNTFDNFIKKVEDRLLASNKVVSANVDKAAKAEAAKVAKTVAATETTAASKKVNDRVSQLYEQLTTQSAKAAQTVKESQDRIRKSLADGTISTNTANRAIIGLDETLEKYKQTLRNVELREEEAVKSTKGHIIQLRQLDDAYAKVAKTASRVEIKAGSTQLPSPVKPTSDAKLKQIDKEGEQSNINNRVIELYTKLSIQAAKAANIVKESQDRIRKAMSDGRISIDSGNKAIIGLDGTLDKYQKTLRQVELREDEKKKHTSAHVLQLRNLEDAYKDINKTITQTESKLNSGNDAFRKATTFSKEFFKGLAIGGFALQQVGATLTQYITQPLERLAGSVFEALFLFEGFDAKLKFYGKSAEEIKKFHEAVADTAKRPNITLEETVDLFDKLVSLTDGKILPERLKAIGQGLSVAFAATPQHARHTVLGELTSILGGEFGDTSNLRKTLNNAPKLQQEGSRLVGGRLTEGNIEKAGFSQNTLITQALNNLASQNVPETLINSFNNLKDVIFELKADIGKIYEEKIKTLFDYLAVVVIPTIDSIIKKLAVAPNYVQNLVLAAGFLLAAIGPIIAGVGLLAVAIAGLGYLGDIVAGMFLYFSGAAIAADVATAGLAETVVSTFGFMDSLGTLLLGVTNFFAGFGAIVLVVGAAVLFAATQIQFVTNEFILLGTTIYEALTPLFSIFGSLGTILYTLIKYFVIGLGYILSPFLFIALRALTIAITFISVPLRVLAAVLEALINLFSGDSWGLVVAKFSLAMAEMQVSIVNAIPFLKDLDEYIAKIFGSETSAQKVERLKKEIEGLTVATTKEAQAQKLASKAAEEAAAKNKQVEKSVEELTKAIVTQTEKLEEQTLAYKEQQLQSVNTQQDVKGIAKQASIERQDKDFDLANPKESRLLKADFDKLTNIQLQEKQRNLQLEFIRKENAFRVDFEKQLRGYKLANKSLRDNIAAVFGDTSIKDNGDLFAPLIAASSLGSDEEYEKVQELIKIGAKQLTVLRLGYREQTGDIDKFVQERRNARIALQDRIKKAEQTVQNEQDTNVLSIVVEDYKKQIANYELAIREIEQIDSTGTDKYNQIAVLVNKIHLTQMKINAVEGNAKYLKTNITPETATMDRLKADQEKTAADRVANDAEIVRMKSVADEISKDRKNAQEILDKAYIAVSDSKEKTDGLQKLISDIRSKENIALQATEYSLFTDAEFLDSAAGADRDIAKLEKVLGSFSGLSKAGKLPETLKSLSNFFTNIPRIGEDLSKEAVTKQLKYATDLVDAMLNVDVVSLSQEEGFIFDDYLKGLQVAVEAVKKLQVAKATAEKNQLEVDRQRKDSINVNKQGRIDDLKDLQDINDLEKQISELRKERYKGTQGGFSAALYDIVIGAEEKANSLEKERLEIVQEIRKLELEILLDRLEGAKADRIAELRAKGASEAEIAVYEKKKNREIELIKKRADLEGKLSAEQIKNLETSSGTFGGVATKILGSIFKKNKKQEPAVNDDSTKKTAANTDEQIGWLDKLTGKMGEVRDISFAVGDALMQLQDLSLQSILKSIKAELDALAKKALIYSLEYAAVALAALVFGDFETAGKAATASAAWAATAAAAGVGSALVGLGVAKDTTAAQKKSDAKAGTSSDKEEKKRIAREKAQEIIIRFDIHQDEGILMEKHIKSINSNTRLTTLTSNTQAGWSFPPA